MTTNRSRGGAVRARRWVTGLSTGLTTALVVGATLSVAACGQHDTPGDAPRAAASPSDASATLAAEAPVAALDPDQAAAGVLSREIPQQGSGELVTVAGSTPGTGTGDVQRLRVQVEAGLPVDGERFADFAMTTLNDDRGWGHDGQWSFERTDGEDVDFSLVLATPGTSEKLCAPLDTRGRVSCRNGDRVVLTYFRWVTGATDFGGDLTAYRQYLVNHEVGHALGFGHVGCPAPGDPAPVMLQQTLGVQGCVPNPWPSVAP